MDIACSEALERLEAAARQQGEAALAAALGGDTPNPCPDELLTEIDAALRHLQRKQAGGDGAGLRPAAVAEVVAAVRRDFETRGEFRSWLREWLADAAEDVPPYGKTSTNRYRGGDAYAGEYIAFLANQAQGGVLARVSRDRKPLATFVVDGRDISGDREALEQVYFLPEAEQP